MTQFSYERVDISSLKFDPKNARKHDKKNIKAIKDSLIRFGQKKPIVLGADGIVVAGNGTLQAAIELGWDTIDVNVTELKGEEAIAYAIADNRTAELAEWDEENLKELLNELNNSGWDLDGLGWDEKDLEGIIVKLDENGNIISEEDSIYTSKIKAPVYEPTGPKPQLKDLFEKEKYNQLINNINKTDLPKEEKDFLKFAALRHIVFNYQNIAEYYAHSEKTVQELFEESALIIIDYDKAIENGFVKMSLEIAEAFKNEND